MEGGGGSRQKLRVVTECPSGPQARAPPHWTVACTFEGYTMSAQTSLLHEPFPSRPHSLHESDTTKYVSLTCVYIQRYIAACLDQPPQHTGTPHVHTINICIRAHGPLTAFTITTSVATAMRSVVMIPTPDPEGPDLICPPADWLRSVYL